MLNGTVGVRLAAIGSLGALVVGLAAPAQAAERTLHDKRGDVKVSDLVATKLMNTENRLIVRARFAKGSVAGKDGMLTVLRAKRKPVDFLVSIGWNKQRNTLRGLVWRRPGRDVTKRCDLKLHKRRNVVRFSVDSDRCFRKAAGPMRFGTAAQRSEDRAPQKRWVTKRAVKRG